MIADLVHVSLGEGQPAPASRLSPAYGGQAVDTEQKRRYRLGTTFGSLGCRNPTADALPTLAIEHHPASLPPER